MIITTTGEKGGTGKSTMAVNLAGMRMARGGDLTLLDADRQGTATIWCDLRNEAGEAVAVPATQSFGRSVYHSATELHRRYEDTLIDMPPGHTLEMGYVLSIADLAIITIQPSHPDAWTIGAMDDMLERASHDNPNLRAICIVNRASTHPRNQETISTINALESCAFLEPHPIPIRDRLSIKRSLGQGQTVEEFRPLDRKAIAEFDSLYQAVFGPAESQSLDQTQIA